MSWRELYRRRLTDADAALERISSGHRVFLGTAAGEPAHLVSALARRAEHLSDLEVVQVWAMGSAAALGSLGGDQVRLNLLGCGPENLELVRSGSADYTPVPLSRLPTLFREHVLHLDVALVQVSLPDAHGFVSLGVSVDATKAAVESADYVVAQVNPAMPRIPGDGFLHVSQVHAFVRQQTPLPTVECPEGQELHEELGRHLASLIPDGATIHVGLGIVPSRALTALMDRRDLGVHTEFFGDWLVELVERGVVTGRAKSQARGRVVAAYCLGTRRLYDFVDANPMIALREADAVCTPEAVAGNDLMVSVVSAQAVDLTGQAAGPLAGRPPYAGPESQADFLRGAARARGGRAVVVLSSTDEQGRSRIVPSFDGEQVVVAGRMDVHYVVTEYGVASLRARSLRERALALVDVAHPDYRRELLEAAKKKRYVFPDELPPSASSLALPRVVEELKDGTQVVVRPISPADERALQQLFYGLNDMDRYYRFFATMTTLPHRAAQRLCRTDFREEVGLVAVQEKDEGEILVGAGHYMLNRKENLAEFAVMVHAAHRNKGIGTALLKHLIRIARQQGIAGLKAQVLPHNRPMLHIIRKYGFPIQANPKEGVFELTLLFRDLPAVVSEAASKLEGEQGHNGQSQDE